MGWDDISNGGQGGGDKKEVNFTKFPVGATTIRLVDSQPFSRWSHWLPQANGGKGFSVSCPGKGCPVCEIIAQQKANKEKAKYNSAKKHSAHVINRTTKQLEVLEQGKTFWSNIKALKDIVGDVTTFDIRVVRQGTGKDDTTYTPVPLPPTPMSAEDVALLQEKRDLSEYYKAPTNEQILQLMQGATLDAVFGTNQDVPVDADADEDVEVDFTEQQ